MKKSISVTVGLTLTTMIYHLFTCNCRQAPTKFEYVWQEREKETVKAYDNISRKYMTYDV